jgi:beta-carotene ketolase (CrtW type)
LQSFSQAIRKANEPQFVVLEKHFPVPRMGFFGLLIAIFIITLWGANLAYLLTSNISSIPFWLLPLSILAQMFLYTGLFITAHDAMHGSLYLKRPKINNLLGSVAVTAYAFLSYKALLQKHWLHHHFPASDRDPDFHDGTHKNPVAWFVHFMKGYFGWRQFNSFTVAYPVAHWLLHIPHVNLILFWLLPLILSAIQLFYFGTYLTHRQPGSGYSNLHRAETTNFSPFWSFITCYHFGYHQEHHAYPHVPWWQLPRVHQARLACPSTTTSF